MQGNGLRRLSLDVAVEKEPSILYHGSKVIVDNPEILVRKYTKDFSWGFYCTKLIGQAERWATRLTGKGVLNEYEFRNDTDLQWKSFDGMSEEWLDFIIGCRKGGTHYYDIVEGPVADDEIFNAVQAYLDGSITRKALWELAAFRKPTHQICFSTVASLVCLKFRRSRNVYRT